MDRQLLLQYKVPLIFGLAGLLFLTLSIIVSVFFSMSDNVQGGIEILQDPRNSNEVVSVAKTFVDIQGAVVSPGVYELPEGSRVADLLEEAGGLLEEADSTWVAKNINQAQPLVDGAKIYIPFSDELPTTDNQYSMNDQSSTLTDQININTATSKELESLSGIGEKTAEKIINGRPYGSVEELLERKIVGQNIFNKNIDKLSVF